MAMAEQRNDKPGRAGAPREKTGWLSRIAPGVRHAFAKRETPENLWVKCPDTGEMIYRPDLEAALWVTPSGHHMRIGAVARLTFTFDDGSRSDLECGRSLGYDAMFSIATGCLGQDGYLTCAVVVELRHRE